ncbi:MAG TPA: HTH-type transcriptional regulator CysB [Burkholderiales bacterium]|nr:HTH-type transcriptional regulator CysB [Burkholderiales bacterium]
MKLQQLRFLCEVVKQGLNVSDAADSLYTSQPGISKQIRLLEEELGIDIFVRNGKRLSAVTEPGKAVISIAGRILQDAENLKRVGEEFGSQTGGNLRIATTHTQARYVLPSVVRRFMSLYPGVTLNLHQGSPMQIAEMVTSGEVDIGIATEAIALFEDLVMLPCYEWNRCVVTLPKHPLLRKGKLRIEDLAEYPIITYDFAFTGRSKINKAFEDKGLTPNVVLTAIDSDVIKTYVEMGLGIGILAKMAFDPERDKRLRAIDASHLFESSMTRIAIRKNSYLRGYMYDFISLFAPHLDRGKIDERMAG